MWVHGNDIAPPGPRKAAEFFRSLEIGESLHPAFAQHFQTLRQMLGVVLDKDEVDPFLAELVAGRFDSLAG
jgi:hypothetical protein